MPKLLMNCDQVFDVLTRGPFPTGDASDAAVEHHLRACHACRTLAEALQPAVEILHESISAAEATGLPEYQGVLARLDHRVAVAEPTRAELASTEAQRRTPLSVRRLPSKVQRRASSVAVYARFTAAIVLLVAMGSLIWGALETTKQPLARTSRSPARLDRAGLVTLALLDLPTQCQRGSGVFGGRTSSIMEDSIPPQTEGPLAAINQEALRCCRECHDAAHPQRPLITDLAPLRQSCTACHSL